MSCHRVLSSWQDGQAGHYKPWGACNGYFKYEMKNIAFQCAYCNGPMSGADTGTRFGNELVRRYGDDILDWIDKENELHRAERVYDHEIPDRVAEFYEGGKYKE